MPESRFEHQPEIRLTDGVVLLRPFHLDDAVEHVAGDDEEAMHWMNEGLASTLESTQRWIRYNQMMWQYGGPVFNFAIVDTASGALSGMIEASTDIQEMAGCIPGDANISYNLYPQARGRGLVARSVQLVLEFLRARGVQRAVLRIEPGNINSLGVPPRCGFMEEALVRDASGKTYRVFTKQLQPSHVAPDRIKQESARTYHIPNPESSFEQQPVIITPARPEDAEQIVSIQAETWLATYPNEEHGITKEDILAKDMGNPSRIERWKRGIEYAATRGDRQVFAAKRGSEVLGYCFVFRKPSGEGYIGALYLRPSEHGKGIGRQLMEASLTWLGDECIISLGVAIYNKAAIALYKKLGFEMSDEPPDPIPPLPSGAQMPIVKMVRPAKR